MSEPTEEPRAFWEQFYGETERTWSGRANSQLVVEAAELTPGRALDLGCGEGADAVWLAEQGWQVVAVDISATALQRAQAFAEERNMASRIRFERHDLSQSFPEGTFDLVSAQFLHAPVELDRAAILGRAAGAVADGGVLLIVDHAAAPSWAPDHHGHHFDTVDEVLAALALDNARWQRVRAEARVRDAVSPAGDPATLTDNVIVLRRVG
ncbi:SAM-dependent methyltransferase [Mycolicibacillus koreensis]|nr:SAM-dependent methyltransferase [Mycolicibacillus koreensis]